MDYFEYKGGELHCEGVPVATIAAEHGTPLYVYSSRTILEHYARLAEAFAAADPLICFSVKSCANLAVLRLLAGAGSGFDVVSGGELYRAMKAGGDPAKIVFAGVAKGDDEIVEALRAGIAFFNVESAAELENISRLAAAEGVKARVALRVNPDVDPQTHKYITTGKAENKFGIDLEAAGRIARDAGGLGAVSLEGVHMHIGSQITLVEPYVEALEKVVAFVKKHRSEAAPLTHVNIGGGFGIFYKEHEAKPPAEFADRMLPILEAAGVRLIMEPGRFIVGNAGVMLTTVRYVKETGAKRFLLVDAGMNDLVRPTLYDAFHETWPVAADVPPPSRSEPDAEYAGLEEADVVGPVCESGDFLAKARPLPGLERGDVLAVFSAGAYGFTMSSNYNARPRAAEVLVEGDSFRLVRRRETYEDLVAPEDGN